MCLGPIENNAFQNCPALTNAVTGNGVTAILSEAFSGCSALSSVTLGNSITLIDWWAFYNCTALKSLTIPDSVTTIGHRSGWSANNYGAFQGCTGLTNVIIGNGVTRIGNSAFNGCSALKHVLIGNSVQTIGEYAFAGCTSLIGIYFRGNAPVSVASSAFNHDYHATVYYATGTTGWGAMCAGLPALPWNLQVQTRDASLGARTNQFGFNFTWESNLVIVVEACTNLVNPVWTPLQTNMLTGVSSYFSDPEWTNYPGRFYRLRSP